MNSGGEAAEVSERILQYVYHSQLKYVNDYE